MNATGEYLKWLVNAEKLKNELLKMNDDEIEDAFYKDLYFGTGGLRGKIGAGTNRMNVYVVARATQGLSNFIKKSDNSPSVVIGYDSRNNSRLFAEKAAEVFSANGIKVYIWSRLLPVPTVSYAVRYLDASAGVMITASHNSSIYNGYKVYGNDGCQITDDMATKIMREIDNLDYFDDIKCAVFSEEQNKNTIVSVPEMVFDSYLDAVRNESVLFGDYVDKSISIVYSPLNGTGYEPITRILNEQGYTNVTVVEEQKNPDGDFPTCPYPNPEVEEALSLGISYCRNINADLLIATDPDCDRVGIAVKEYDDYRLLNGNEVGVLLLDYICSQRTIHGKMPRNPLLVKTIVTTELGEIIAKEYHLDTINVLTGFKYIGEQIGLLEEADSLSRFVFGFEESYGYLSGTTVRDKDAVNATLLICEMFCFFKTRGISLIDKLNEIYSKYGFCLNRLHSIEFDGFAGAIKIRSIMEKFRTIIPGYSFNGIKVEIIEDYIIGLKQLPKSNVLRIILEDKCSFIVRPSGTEPKIKMYLSVIDDDREQAIEKERRLFASIEAFLAEYLK